MAEIFCKSTPEAIIAAASVAATIFIKSTADQTLVFCYHASGGTGFTSLHVLRQGSISFITSLYVHNKFYNANWPIDYCQIKIVDLLRVCLKLQGPGKVLICATIIEDLLLQTTY